MQRIMIILIHFEVIYMVAQLLLSSFVVSLPPERAVRHGRALLRSVILFGFSISRKAAKRRKEYHYLAFFAY
jgi:hypothetical protein